MFSASLYVGSTMRGFTGATVRGVKGPRGAPHRVGPVPLATMSDPVSPQRSSPTSTGPTTAAPTEVRSALPSVGARVLAFLAIILTGAAGAFIGYAFVDLQTTGDATVATGIGALVGALIAAGGTAVVVVLTLRAMGEWRTIQATRPPTSGPTPDGGVRKTPRVR